MNDFLEQILSPTDHSVDPAENIEYGSVEKLSASDAHVSAGSTAIKEGRVAFCILAGDEKCLFRLPKMGMSLLALKLLQSEGAPHRWVMTSPGNRSAVESHLSTLSSAGVKIFDQFESPCLTPDNRLHFLDGEPLFSPCGHGDVISALRESGILEDFVKSGGEHVFVVNSSNALGYLSSALVGEHMSSGYPVTCEVVQKLAEEHGGVLAHAGGFEQIVEDFRLLPGNHPESFSYLSTNSMVFNAALDFDSLRWKWHRVKNLVGGSLVVKYQRYLQDITSHFKTNFIESDRTRYFHVRSTADLAAAESLLDGGSL